jgi:hypothetical protein
MRGDKFDLVSFYAYKFSAALFLFFCFSYYGVRNILKPNIRTLVIQNNGNGCCFFVSVLEWRGVFVGKFGTAIYKGSVSAC